MISILAGNLHKALAIYRAINKNPDEPTAFGRFTFNHKTLCALGSDGHILASITVPLEDYTDTKPCSVQVPFAEIKKLVKAVGALDKKERLELTIDNKRLFISAETSLLSTPTSETDLSYLEKAAWWTYKTGASKVALAPALLTEALAIINTMEKGADKNHLRPCSITLGDDELTPVKIDYVNDEVSVSIIICPCRVPKEEK